MSPAVAFRLNDELAARIDRVADALAARNGGEEVSKSAVLRRAVRAGLAAMERDLGIDDTTAAAKSAAPAKKGTAKSPRKAK